MMEGEKIDVLRPTLVRGDPLCTVVQANVLGKRWKKDVAEAGA